MPIPGANYKWTITIGDLTEEGFTEFAEFYDHVRDSVTNLFPQANYKVKLEPFSSNSKLHLNISNILKSAAQQLEMSKDSS